MDNAIDNLELATDVDETEPDKITLSKIEFPEHMINIKDMAVIQSVVDDLLVKVTDAINGLNADLHIDTATEDGIARREKIYGIEPSDTATLEERRFVLRLRASDPREYTEKYLRKHLDDLVGAENYSLNIDYQSMTMALYISLDSKTKEAAVKKLVQSIVPLHVKLIIDLMWNTWDIVTSGRTWGDLSTGTWKRWKEESL